MKNIMCRNLTSIGEKLKIFGFLSLLFYKINQNILISLIQIIPRQVNGIFYRVHYNKCKTSCKFKKHSFRRRIKGNF